MAITKNSDSEIVLETQKWVVRQLLTFSGVQKYTKHTGWCTQRSESFTSEYLNAGKLFVFRKRGKRRPSYQLFIRDTGTTEFKHKGNLHADIWDFQENETDLTNWLSERVKGREEQVGSATIFGEFPPYDINRYIGEIHHWSEANIHSGYRHGDIVVHDGQIYVLASGSGAEDPSNSDNWTLVSREGA